MKRISLLAAILITGNFLFAQNQTKKNEDPLGKQAIDKLCGCFEVGFKYAETFSPDTAYKFHNRENIGGVEELAIPIEVTDKRIVIQHLLIVGNNHVIKHWREDWTYENPVLWEYQGDKVWTKKTVPAQAVKGKWTQTVWEVSDEPRYQGYSQFVNLDGMVLWQSTNNAPLPRREYTTRSDYNILKRTNRLNLTDSGYLHEQDNKKIIRANGSDKLLAEEKGLNSYKKIDVTKCAAATEYWEKNKAYWSVVRKAWDDYINNSNRIELKTKVDGKPLYEYLFAMEKEYAAAKIVDKELYQKVKDKITLFAGKSELSSSASY